MSAIRRIEIPDAEAMEKFLPLRSAEDYLRKAMQMLVDKGQVRKGTVTTEQSQLPLQAYLDMLWKANSVDDVQACYDALDSIKKHYPEENVEWIEKIISNRPEPKQPTPRGL